MNKRRLRGAHSVFKSVFDQSDKQQRSDQHTFPIVRQIDLQLYISRQPQTHQLDITLHEIQFMIERYEFLIVFIQHMPQQPAQIMDGKLGPVRIDSDQGINIIEGIEQEMRVQLAFQILQFRFGTGIFQFFFFLLEDIPVFGHPDSDTQSRHQSHHHSIPDNKNTPWRKRSRMPRSLIDKMNKIILLPSM